MQKKANDDEITLGLCCSSNQLFYAISSNEAPDALTHIGCFDFNFNVARAIRTQDVESFPAIYDLLGRLKKQYGFRKIRMLTLSDHECWTTLPKLVYDEADEREDHLKIIMKGLNRHSIEPTWFDLSNMEFKFLSVRNKEVMSGFERLSDHAHQIEFCSAFELGHYWIDHKKEKNSFMMIYAVPGMISVFAYILGKLRGATYIKFEEIEDIGYLWPYNAGNLNWMKGFYDQVYLLGSHVDELSQILKTTWENHTPLMRFDTLETMQVTAKEQTYSFSLEAAFPAILLALNND